MRKLRVLLLAAAFTYAPAVYADEVFDIDAYIDQANVLVGDESRDFCSGTVISIKERLVLTADHCVVDKVVREEKEFVDPVTGEVTKKMIEKKLDLMVAKNVTQDYEKVSRRSWVAKIFKRDAANDVAILQVVDPTWVPTYEAKLAPDDYKMHRGEKVRIVGNPGISLDNSVTEGIVSNTERLMDMDGKKMRMFQTDAQAIGGNSGGSVLNSNGELIGTLSAGYRGTTITFAIPISATKALLKGAATSQPVQAGTKAIGHKGDGGTVLGPKIEFLRDMLGAGEGWKGLLARIAQ